jgi:hypothetical protein
MTFVVVIKLVNDKGRYRQHRAIVCSTLKPRYGIWLLERLRLAKHVRIAKFTRRDPRQTVSTTHMTTS